MRNNIIIMFGLVGGLFLGCSDDGAGDTDCQDGTEMCACAGGTMCFSGLVCSNGMCFPDASTGDDTSGNDTDSGADTTGGGGVANENAMCERLDECNYLEAGVSATDCADTLGVCTADLISSAYADWNNEAMECLELSNCKNLQDCLADLPDCSPVEGTDDGTCVEDGDPCDFCWGGQTCDPAYIGTNDGCDCNCGGGVTDPDCG